MNYIFILSMIPELNFFVTNGTWTFQFYLKWYLRPPLVSPPAKNITWGACYLRAQYASMRHSNISSLFQLFYFSNTNFDENYILKYLHFFNYPIFTIILFLNKGDTSCNYKFVGQSHVAILFLIIFFQFLISNYLV